MLYETAARSPFAVTEQNQQLPGFMAYTKTSNILIIKVPASFWHSI
jgi:hypothetical protein